MLNDMSVLVSDFREVVEEVLKACLAQGIEMRVYNTLRDPWTQAKYWRQSRSKETIEQTLKELEQAGATFLANVLQSVGPQYGKPITKAIPGLSWHQWGEAVDAFWLLDKKEEWSTRKKVVIQDGRTLNGYALYAEEAQKKGLTAGGLWTDLKDWPHIQKRAKSVREYYSWQEIDQQMQARFGETPPAA